MQPSAVILVSYVREDGEIVADYITITVELSFENKVVNKTLLFKLLILSRIYIFLHLTL